MIGICDVDTQLFIQLYTWARVKPSIVQINLASCCVVPPELAEFCKENSIQLLTHSDPISKHIYIKQYTTTEYYEFQVTVLYLVSMAAQRQNVWLLSERWTPVMIADSGAVVAS